METITVITTTYNRAYCLHQVYESLLRQTCKDFMWLIIDDGSTDDTPEIVENWIKEDKIHIEYHYKPNGGMHTARNLAYSLVNTELNVIIDSDDWMTDDAIEIILDFWAKNKDDKYAGIVSNNVSPKGDLIGTPLPTGVSECKFSTLFDKYKVCGDKKLIYRSELTRLYPYPEFEGEKFFPASYKFRLLDLKYKMLLLDKYTCVVDYSENSMTFQKVKQYQSCPKSFAYSRNEMIRISKSPKFIIKEMIHYIAESKLAGNKHYIINSSKPTLALLCFPVGILYYYYIMKKLQKG